MLPYIFFERGVASELSIPLDLIAINITTVSDDFISFYLFLFPILTISPALLIWARNHPAKRSLSFSGICVIYVFSLYAMGATSKEKILLSVFYSLILLYLLTQFIPVESKNKIPVDDKARQFGLQAMSYGAFLFFFAFTFTTLGRESVYKSQFNTFSDSGNEYAIVKIYDENVFAWSVDNGKLVHKLTYFRMENINGVELKNMNFKRDRK
ncbi:hypothetical protein [Serratia liquefaciens]|uniref:hypothetical protein n=1 Tax=Serratia liquefaciens TaxID=614 RepID=UPI000967F6FD|nr:hypothetical protein [Serratia liquefaciens]OKP25621.1 hypothetical protein BSQ35_03915 [Serratia liquefaciens]